MSGSKYVPLALLACSLGACEQSAGAPEFENVAGRTLALCEPQPERKHTVSIGVAGGSFAAPGALLEIPAGALDKTTTFTIRIPQSTFAEIEVTANGQHSFNFLRPVTIGIDYSRCTADPAADASVWHIDPATKLFLEEMGGVNDPLNQRVVFSTMHLSGYAIAN